MPPSTPAPRDVKRNAPRIIHGSYRATSGSWTVHTSSELEEQLRHRMRVAFVMWAVAAIAIAATTAIARREHIRQDPLTLITEPPLPGALFVIALVTLAMAGALSSQRHFGLARLRLIEWLSVVTTAGFFVVYQARALPGVIPELSTVPMDLGLGLAAPWGALIVAYSVLIPRGVRHGIARTLVLAFCAFIPELLIFPNTRGMVAGITIYLVLKAVLVIAMSTLAVYGAYRIEMLQQDAHEARQLGQYVLRELLGSGGMGEVYRADHQYLRRPCAVKLIRAERAGDAAALARFEREVQAAAALTHPNTVQIYDYGHSEDGTFYYAMEYLPGISLEELVTRHGPLPPARAVRILVQVCGALREAHGRGLVHRDLKPGNVMLCERGGVHDVAKLLDFGLVYKEYDEPTDPKVTQVGAILGTPAFMSPEQCEGEATVTSASDIYSLGGIGFFLLTGRPPFIGRSTIQMIVAHVLETPPPVNTLRDEIPVALADVIARTLVKNPADRYPDAASLERALRASVEPDEWGDDDAHDWWRTHELAPAKQM
jgi:serine/threonine-protein kinase